MNKVPPTQERTGRNDENEVKDEIQGKLKEEAGTKKRENGKRAKENEKEEAHEKLYVPILCPLVSQRGRGK